MKIVKHQISSSLTRLMNIEVEATHEWESFHQQLAMSQEAVDAQANL